ncbi:MAG: hypothetical protein V8T86_01035 [Victivallis sp.]
MTDTVGTLEELADRLPGLLREIGLGTEAKKRGIYAMLHPVITAKNPPDYLSASFSSGLESFLLGKGMRLQNLRRCTRFCVKTESAASMRPSRRSSPGSASCFGSTV